MNSVSGSNQLSLTRLWQSASESKSTIRQVGAAAAIFISTVTVIPIVTDIITTCVRARSARRVEPVALTPSQGPGPDRNLTPDNKHDRPESPCVRSDTGPTPEAQERASHISRCIANMIQERGDNSFYLGLITREASDPEQLQSLTDIAKQLPVRWDMDFENAPKFVSAWRELRALIADAPLTSRMEVAQSLVKSLTNNSHYLINNPRKGKPLEFQPESDAELTAALYKKYPGEQIYLPPMYGRLDPKEAVQEGELFLAHLTRSLLANGVDACDALLYVIPSAHVRVRRCNVGHPLRPDKGYSPYPRPSPPDRLSESLITQLYDAIGGHNAPAQALSVLIEEARQQKLDASSILGIQLTLSPRS